ncbi:MAG: 50S ribosomal protein L25, partial [bacterium]
MSFILNAVKRTEKGEKTRKSGVLPGVYYGAGKEAVSIDLNLPEFIKLFKETGESSLIDLNLDGKNVGKALVQHVQYDPVSERVIHVDFRLIDMNKILMANVVLRYVGES